METVHLSNMDENGLDSWPNVEANCQLLQTPPDDLLADIMGSMLDPQDVCGNLEAKNTKSQNTKRQPGGKHMKTMWEEHQQQASDSKRSRGCKKRGDWEVEMPCCLPHMDYKEHPFLTPQQNMVFRQIHGLMLNTNLMSQQWNIDNSRARAVGKKHNCTLCEKTYSKKWSLQQHVLKQHPDQGQEEGVALGKDVTD